MQYQKRGNTENAGFIVWGRGFSLLKALAGEGGAGTEGEGGKVSPFHGEGPHERRVGGSFAEGKRNLLEGICKIRKKSREDKRV